MPGRGDVGQKLFRRGGGTAARVDEDVACGRSEVEAQLLRRGGGIVDRVNEEEALLLRRGGGASDAADEEHRRNRGGDASVGSGKEWRR